MPRCAQVDVPTGSLLGRLATLGACLLALGAAAPASASSPGLDALEQYKLGHDEQQAVENRFFLKANRFEISPIVGYVPNNPFARRYMIGGIAGYHFSETLSVQMALQYSPDLGENDLKGLTSVLLERAHQAEEDTAFQQPLDKAGLTAAFGVAWAPLYGKINLVGETVLNFDFYLFGGAGMISKHNFFAVYDDANIDQGDILTLNDNGNQVVVGPYLGLGQNYFVNQIMAVKLDVRAAFYVDKQPQYDPNVPVDGQRLYNNVTASAGIALFFPRMKRQLYEF
ncbi:MAG: outer membrane beta-barrel domain-containing protein [Myxococcota bacterium]